MNRPFVATLSAIAVAGVYWAVPNFAHFNCKAAQSEARSGLEAMVRAQQAHRTQTGRYGSLEELMAMDGAFQDVVTGSVRYTFRVAAVSPGDFRIEAVDDRNRLVPTSPREDRWGASASQPTPERLSDACTLDTAADFWLRAMQR